MQSTNASMLFAKQTPPIVEDIAEERIILNEFLERNLLFKDALLEFITHLKRKDYNGTLQMAHETLKLLNKFITAPKSDWDNPSYLIKCLRKYP